MIVIDSTTHIRIAVSAARIIFSQSQLAALAISNGSDLLEAEEFAAQMFDALEDRLIEERGSIGIAA